MGEDASRGVVDADGHVFGAPGLSVLDGAIVPSALAVNPSLTIAALVERAMTNRVTALDRPDAALLRPADVRSGRDGRLSPSRPVPVPDPGPRRPATPAAGSPTGRLPATGASGAAGWAGILAGAAGALALRWVHRTDEVSAATSTDSESTP